MLFDHLRMWMKDARLQGFLRWCGLVLTVTLSMVGCGYQFTVEGPGPMIGGGRVAEGPPVRLALHTLQNKTFEPTLEFKYTQYLRRALESAGSATIVEDDLSADFILDGAIVSVTLPSLAFSQVQTQESRVTVKVSVKVKERKTGEVRWSQTGINSAEFFVGATSTTGGGVSGLQFNRVLQDRALEQAGQGVADDLADRFLSARDQGTFGVDSPKKASVPGSGNDDVLAPSQNSNTLSSPNAPVQK